MLTSDRLLARAMRFAPLSFAASSISKLVFAAALVCAVAAAPWHLQAQTVDFIVCNAGKVDVDAILLQSGRVSSSHIGPADCATVAESTGGMRPAYVGFAFADSKGQWGAARRLDILPSFGSGVLTAASQNASIRRGNQSVAVQLQLLFQPPNPVCTTHQTYSESANLPLNASARERAAAANADAARGGGETVCDALVFKLNVEAFPDSGEVTFLKECDPCDKKQEAQRTPEERAAEQRRAEVVNSAIDTASGMGPGGAIFRSVVDRERQEKREEALARESRLSPTQRVNWSDLLPALRNMTPASKLWDVVPRNLIIRGTVSNVEVSQDAFEPDTQWVDIAFRESPVTDVSPNRRPYSEFNLCTSNQDLLRDVFGANFRTSMIGKIIEVEGESQAAYCRGLLGSIRVTLAHQIRPVASALFAADTRVWAPPPVAAPRAPTNAEIEGQINSDANMVAGDVQLRASVQLGKACVEQSDKAREANPRNSEAINKEYFACRATVEEGAKKEAQKARDCAVQASKANAARGPSARKDINKDLEPCFQLSATASRTAPAPTPPVAPNPAPIPSTIAAPIPAPAAPVAAPAQRSTPVPSAPDPAAAAAARAKAEQEQQQRIAEQQAKAQQEQEARLAEQERIRNQALQKAQDVQACMQQVLKDSPDGGRSNPQAYQSRIMACAQVAQQPAK